MADITVLEIKKAAYRFMGEARDGTATGGDTGSLVDAGLVNLAKADDPTDRYVRVHTGAAAGQVRRIAKYEPGTGTLRPHRPFSGAVAATDSYSIWGSSIDPSDELTSLIADVLRRLRYSKTTRVPLINGRTSYDISSLVEKKTEVIEVYLHVLDAAGYRPYSEQEIDSWQARPAQVIATQQVVISGTPTGGHYHLLLGAVLSDEIAFNADAATVQAAIRAMRGLEGATVASAGVSPNYTHTATFPSGALETPLTADATALTGGTPSIDTATATTRSAVLLDIYPAQTVPEMPMVPRVELWVEHWTNFVAVTADTDTMDETYQDWIAWEVITEHAARKVSNQTDKGRWQNLYTRASQEARSLRRHHNPPQHVRANPSWHFEGK